MKALSKKAKIILLTLVSVFLLSSISILIFNCVGLSKQKHHESKVDAAYTFDDTNGRFTSESDSNYSSNTDFYITTPKGLHEFSVSVAYGCTFFNKKVYLSNDISMSGWNNWQPIGASMNGTTLHNTKTFAGHFDGNGHTVSNLSTTIDDSPRGSHFYLGFFTQLTEHATVENLRIKDFTINLNEDHGYANVGGIAGAFASAYNSYTSIKNCTVDGFSINSKVTQSSYAGIVGVVQPYDVTLESLPRMENVHLKSFTADVTSSFVYSLCTYAVCEVENYVVQETEYPVNSEGKFANGWDSTNKIFSDDDSIVNSTGGPWGTTLWYWAGDYNDGYPYLRDFISWQLIVFSGDTADDPDSYVSVNSIHIPEGLDASILKDTRNLEFYERTLSLNYSDCFEFTKWNYTPNPSTSHAGSYKMEIERKTLNIKFASVSNATATCGANTSLNTNYNLGCGGVVRVTYGTKNIKEGYKSITIYFIDMDNVQRSVTYTANAGYVIEKSSIISAGNPSKVICLEDNISSVTAVVKVKSYNTTFE